MVNVYGSWIPELLFLNSLIGYLIFLIFFKYITVTPSDSKDAPSLLIGMVVILLRLNGIFLQNSLTIDNLEF